MSPDNAAPRLVVEAEDGSVIDCGFTPDGQLCAAAGERAWSWKNYALADTRARRSIESHPSLPEAARATLLAPDDPLHLDYDEGWFHGSVTDTRHKHYTEASEIGHFRFAFNDTMLVTARRHPLQSVDDVWRVVEARKRAFRRPADLVEAVVTRSLERISGDLATILVELDSIEDSVVTDAWHRQGGLLAAARRRLIFVHRHAAALSSLFRQMLDLHLDELPETLADMVARLANRAVALLQESEQLQSRARLLQDEMMARLTAESNRLLYVLSMLTGVLLPMTIVSGLFGMNVGGIPLAEHRIGFWLVSAFAALVAAGVFVAIRRLGRRG